MKDETCIFCKLANGDIPTNSIFEDEDFNVILDAAPATKGHALILPKEHFKDVYELDQQIAKKVLPLAKKLANHMKTVLKCDGVNILQNNGEEAGQTVFHFHMHVIPRYHGEESILNWSHASFSDEEMQQIKEQLYLSK